MNEGDRDAPADVEIGGAFRGRSVRRLERTRTQVEALGDVESEELVERELGPERPIPGRTYRAEKRRWRFSAWARSPKGPGTS